MVGGGAVAGRKVRGLLAAGARVTVVAPEAGDEVGSLARNGRLRWVPRRFDPGDLDGMVLAFAATSDSEVNRRVVAEGEGRGIWVNAADDPEASGFHVPAVHRRGGLALAVATGGAVPSLAAWVRDWIARELPAGIEDLEQLARQLRQVTPAPDGRRLRELFDSGILEDLARGDREAAQRKVAAVFGKGQ